MRNKLHTRGMGRKSERADTESADFENRRGGPRRGRKGGRLFDYGELRLLILFMISEQPSHGYELIKAIEERFNGSYSPSPGVIYPTLTWLEDMGYAETVAAEGTRKRYQSTEEGRAFLTANKASLDDMKSRAPSGGRRKDVPAPVMEAMDNLKMALRQRFRQGPVGAEEAEKIAAAINTAARSFETIVADVEMTSFAKTSIATEQASRYLQQLCKHFQHKRPVRFDTEAGEVSFSVGICKLRADEAALNIELSSAGSAELEELKDVVIRHLERFAFREELNVEWEDS